jgi:hypothetical protein
MDFGDNRLESATDHIPDPIPDRTVEFHPFDDGTSSIGKVCELT